MLQALPAGGVPLPGAGSLRTTLSASAIRGTVLLCPTAQGANHRREPRCEQLPRDGVACCVAVLHVVPSIGPALVTGDGHWSLAPVMGAVHARISGDVPPGRQGAQPIRGGMREWV